MTLEQLERAATLRAEIARRRLKSKDVADRAGIHPKHLSAVLNGRATLTARTQADIFRAIAELIREEAVS